MRNYICGCFNTSLKWLAETQHCIQRSAGLQLGKICLNILTFLLMLCDMWNYAPFLKEASHLVHYINSKPLSNEGEIKSLFFGDFFYQFSSHRKKLKWVFFAPCHPVKTIFFISNIKVYCKSADFSFFSCFFSVCPLLNFKFPPRNYHHTHAHFPQLVSLFNHWSFERKAVQRSERQCGFNLGRRI